MTAIQRFGSVRNLNVHFHTLVPDGVFVPDGDGGARFVPLPAPTDDDVAAICARVARRILRLVDGDDDCDDDDGAGALLADASRSPMGTLPLAMMMPPPPAKRLTANVDDFTLHADTAVAASDRDGLYRTLERLSVRYASWDLSMVHLVDDRSGTLLAPLYPLDRARNGTQSRRVLAEVASASATTAVATTSPSTIPEMCRWTRGTAET